MIFALLNMHQWVVAAFVAFFLFSLVWEVLIWKACGPWSERNTPDDPPPVIGGVVFGLCSVIALWAVMGLIHGLVWLWNEPMGGE